MTVGEDPVTGAVTEQFLLDFTFESNRYDARPSQLRPRTQRRRSVAAVATRPFEADGRNAAYVDWLYEQSMLKDATVLARQLAGHRSMFRNPYAEPNPRGAVEQACVWYTAYPLSLATRKGQSFLAALGSDELWEVFEKVGIDAVHTGPVKLAGGISGWNLTPSVDGHFDRISMAIDPAFGTEDEFRAMCEAAANHGGTIIDDLVPGHTGKGADFRLAEVNFSDYPGIYHMVSIAQEAWHLLPDVPEGVDSVNLDPEAEKKLADEGYIIGELQRVIFYEVGVKETNWSVTRPVYGVDGVLRRWVYLHYFKDGQPSIDWLDPTFAGMRLVMGDALHSLTDLGSGGLRLDANGFLGVERRADPGPAWSEGHPMSLAANQLMGSMVRKVGGFTFQELNLAMDDIAATSKVGPDLSYDFVTRPAYQYALLTGDTEFLRLTLREAIKLGIDQASLVHALQNHDDLTFELVHFESAHCDDEYELEGRVLTGRQLAAHVRARMLQTLAGTRAPYNLAFAQNGIACTTASIAAAALGISDLENLTEKEINQIKQAHLLMAMYNAWQPGVFALSGWDLVGALPLPRDAVKSLIALGDTRWIARGAYDLMGWGTRTGAAESGMAPARALYGNLPDQLQDPDSFASKLAEILKLRSRHNLATGALLDVPEVPHPAMLTMVNRLAAGAVQITVLNFGQTRISARVQSEHIPAGGVVDLVSRRRVAEVDGMHGFTLDVPGFGGRVLLINHR